MRCSGEKLGLSIPLESFCQSGASKAMLKRDGDRQGGMGKTTSEVQIVGQRNGKDKITDTAVFSTRVVQWLIYRQICR